MRKAIPKAVVLIPYVGSWPSYFPLFLDSCAKNPWLDVLFFTDCPTPASAPSNVKFLSATLNSICQLASEKLKMTLNFTFGYKLCDLRPFYGKVFEDYLKGYQYWGYGDIDLLYGNLSQFLVPQMEEEFDVISNRKEIVAGSLSLIRNTEFMVNLGQLIPEWRERLQHPRYMSLDETANSDIVWKGGTKADLPEQCFTKLVYHKMQAGELIAYFRYNCREHLEPNEQIHYKDGNFIAPDGVMGYVHFVLLKCSFSFRFPNWQKLPDEFFITDTGFYLPEKKNSNRITAAYRKLYGKGRLWASRTYNKIRG